MHSHRLAMHAAGGVLLAALATITVAQDERPKTRYSQLLNIDALIDNHARFLARRYNLSDEQEVYTLAFLRENADAFMSRHKEQLFSLVDELVDVRTGGEMDKARLIEWGQRALPMYEEAKQLIVDGNMKWRDILTEEQKLTHDKDLEEMHRSFETTEDQLARIISGEMTLDEFRRGPGRSVPTQPPVTAEDPAPRTELPPEQPGPRTSATPPQMRDGRNRSTPAKPHTINPQTRGDRPSSAVRTTPSSVRTTRSGGASTGDGFESKWEAYVREFIEKYQLNERQKQRAESILKDCQTRANRLMERRKPALEQLEKDITGLASAGDKDKLKELAELKERKDKLMEPVDQIFEKDLKPRLERLPTRAQRQAVDDAGKNPRHAATPTPGRRPSPTPPPDPSGDESEGSGGTDGQQ